jgi:HD superfamily phosphohydrolase YqeK
MDLLTKLLFVADCIELNRKAFPALLRIRELAKRDLDAAVVEVFQSKLDYIRSKGYTEHPDTARALSAFEADHLG